MPDDTPLNEKGTQFELFCAEHVTKTEALFSQLQQIATQAIVISLSIFTNGKNWKILLFGTPLNPPCLATIFP